MRRVTETVPLEVCQLRALIFLKSNDREFAKASSVAYEIWPGVEFKAQGAGAAASRILKRLEKAELVTWDGNEVDWGWKITPAGRMWLESKHNV